jgi:hypothetical protein
MHTVMHITHVMLMNNTTTVELVQQNFGMQEFEKSGNGMGHGHVHGQSLAAAAVRACSYERERRLILFIAFRQK